MCACTVIDHGRHTVQTTKSATRDKVEWRDCCSLHTMTYSVMYYSTHTRRNVIYNKNSKYNKNSNGFLNNLGGMKKEKQVW